VRSPPCFLLALGLSLTAFAIVAPARADASAWVFVGGGGLGWKQGSEGRFSGSGALAFDVGVGTSPDGPVIVGGLFRVEPILGSGTDLALVARVATHGFQAGGFGLAFDAGGYARFWGTPSQGFAGGLTVGAPLGFQISLQTMVGTDKALAFGAVAGVDLLRLTVYRQTMLEHWQNPSPAWKRLGRALGLAVPRL
jgi:hypothetical protein